MTTVFENAIRAAYSRHTITVYQAYSPAIAEPAVRSGRFVPPFNMNRMTWIKPSLLWLMARSNWARKRGQERILAIAISRDDWLGALRAGVLTAYRGDVHGSYARWQKLFADADVHVQWDPERDLRGRKLGINSIQVGVGRALIRSYAEEWIVSIRDITPQIRKIHDLLTRGKLTEARRHLPRERPFAVPADIGKQLGMS